jgi:hypothetical protein
MRGASDGASIEDAVATEVDVAVPRAFADGSGTAQADPTLTHMRVRERQWPLLLISRSGGPSAMEDDRIARILEEIAQADRYVFAAEEHVARQKARLAMGRVSPFSTAVLHSLEDALLSFKKHRDLLKRELYEADGARCLATAMPATTTRMRGSRLREDEPDQDDTAATSRIALPDTCLLPSIALS